jgi:hypothetical protein
MLSSEHATMAHSSVNDVRHRWIGAKPKRQSLAGFIRMFGGRWAIRSAIGTKNNAGFGVGRSRPVFRRVWLTAIDPDVQYRSQARNGLSW